MLGNFLATYDSDAAGAGRVALCVIASGSITSNPARKPVLPSQARHSHTHSRGSGNRRFGDSFQCFGIGRHRLTAGRRSSRGLRLQQRFRRGVCTSRVRVPRRNSGSMRRTVQSWPSGQPRSVVSSASSSSPSVRLTPDQSLPPTVVPPAPFAITRASKGFNRVSGNAADQFQIVCAGEHELQRLRSACKKGVPLDARRIEFSMQSGTLTAIPTFAPVRCARRSGSCFRTDL